MLQLLKSWWEFFELPAYIYAPLNRNLGFGCLNDEREPSNWIPADWYFRSFWFWVNKAKLDWYVADWNTCWAWNWKTSSHRQSDLQSDDTHGWRHDTILCARSWTSGEARWSCDDHPWCAVQALNRREPLSLWIDQARRRWWQPSI